MTVERDTPIDLKPTDERDTMENRESVIERVKKLLAMTESAGCTQAEAIQAALMAQKLIVEHDIDEDDLHENRAAELVDEVMSTANERVRGWGKYLSDVVACAFRCQATFRKIPGVHNLRIVFTGHATDAEAACLVYEKLYAAGHRLSLEAGERKRKAWRAAARAEGAPEWWVKEGGREAGVDAYNSFSWGFLDGVRAELEKQSQELMVTIPADVQAAIKSRKPKSVSFTRSGGSHADYEHGVEAGRDAVRAGRIGESQAHMLTA